MAASASRIANAGLYRSLTYRCLQKPSCASLYREAVPRPYKSSAVIVSATVRGFRSTASNMAPIERVHTEKAPIAGPYVSGSFLYMRPCSFRVQLDLKIHLDAVCLSRDEGSNTNLQLVSSNQDRELLIRLRWVE